MMRQWTLLLIAAQWGSAPGQEMQLIGGAPSAAPSAGPSYPSSECPRARFDMQANRYMVEPVSERIRAVLELRYKIRGHSPCTGPLVAEPDDTFSFEASHFIPERDLWQGVLTQAPERLINAASGRSKRDIMENNMRESAEDFDGAENEREEQFEVCVVKKGLCIATLERPPLRSVFDRLGMFTLRERTPQINAYLSWMCAIFVIFLVVVLVQVMFVHFLLSCLFRDRADRHDDQEHLDDEPTTFEEKVVPTSYEVIMQVCVSLGRMALAASTLIVVCCVFVFKREVDLWDGRIMTFYPLLIMFLHMLVVMLSTFKTLLYNSLLRDQVHIVFKSNSMTGMIASPLWILVFGFTIIFLYTGLNTLIDDARTGSCIVAETGDNGGECSTLQMCLKVGISFWGLLFPVAYCIFLIFQDFFFENSFMPLYKIFNLDDKMEAAPYLGALTSVTYSDFTTAAHQLYVEAKKKNMEDGRDEGWSSGVYDVTAKGIIAKLADMKKDDRPGDEAEELADTWFGREAKTPRWFAESLSMWSWRLRMRHSKKKALELRLLLVVVTAAFAWTLLAAFGASVYRQLCIPSLEEVTTSIGQLSPEFDPNVFNYNIFVDTHIKSAGLEVIAEKKFTATTAFHMPGLSEDPQTDPWIKKAKNVHVPFLVRNALMNRNASQGEELRASRRAPVPIELHVRGAGTTLVYRITVVKLETRVASLTYKYNTSSSVDEVVVHKEVDWERVMPAEEVGAEKEEFAEDTEGAAVYVPDDTKEVLIDMKRELAIFGPTGGFVVSGFELAKFEAVRKLQLCPPSGRGAACEEQDSGAAGTSRSKVNLDKSVTALPVELQPDGTDPLRFFVSIIRISNRLINLEMEGAMGARATGGGEWASMGFLPAFRPLVDKYETFFEVPEARVHDGQSEKEEWHTLFLRVMPQGNARSNRLEAELTPNREGDEDLELFCRPAADDGADEPLDPTVEAATKDLSCGASEEEVVKAEAGKPTEELIIRAGDLAFRNHFYVRYKYRLSDPKPFTLTLRVMFHDAVLKGVNETGTDMILSHRTYEVKFLPQAPMRLDFFAPLPQLEPPQSLQEPVADATSLVVQTHSKRGLRLRKQEPLKPAQNFGLPIFLTPPFSSEVLVYDAMVPAGSAGDILIRMTGSHSLWVGSGDQPLEGVGRGSALRQTIKVQHGPNCGDDEESVFAGAPMPAPVGTSALCPVSLRIFERRDGFPRSYGIRLQEAPPDTVLLVGLLHHDQGGSITAMPMPGFQPGQMKVNSTFCDMDWHWELPSVPSPAPASPTEQASPASAAEPAVDAAAKGAAEEASEEASEKAKQPEEVEAASSGATDQEAAASSLVPNEKAVPTQAPKLGRQAAKEQAANDLNDVIQPPAIEKTIPREARPEPTSEPRKMDQEALLPFFLQTDSEPARQVHEPDGIFEGSTEDDNEAPLFGPLALLPAAKKESIAVAVTPSPAQRTPQQAEAPLFSSFFRGGAALAPAAALPTVKATTTTAAPQQDPTAWESGEPLPRATLAVLAGSPSAQISARWNNLELPLGKKEGAWSYVKTSGKMLVEGCWCDRKHLANRCKDMLRKQAPLALKLYYRSNQCLLSISSNGKLMHQIEVGLAGASSPALQERALEEAADSAGAAVKLLRLSRGMPPQAAPVLPHSSEPELLIAP